MNQVIPEQNQMNVASIFIEKGFNPRKFFDDAEHKDLTESVREEGVIQPIVIRPKKDSNNEYTVIAGERRWRASVAAELETIPVVVRDVDDNKARIIASVENLHRADMGLGDEARLALTIVSSVDGDKTQAAKTLGWSRSKLDSRILLNNAASQTLDALNEKTISLKIAELLCGLPEDTQVKTLTKAIENKVEASVLLEKLIALTRNHHLIDAKFDTSKECATCQHNTGLQIGLFSSSLDEGSCLKPTCWVEKTEATIQVIMDELTETYSSVFTDLEKTNESHCLVMKDGDNGVGQNQFYACKECASFGVLVSMKPKKEGTFQHDVCFDTACNKEKQTQYEVSLKAIEAASNTVEVETNDVTTNSDEKSLSANKSLTKDETPSTHKVSQKVIEIAVKANRQAASNAIKKSPKMILVSSVIALYELVNTLMADKILEERKIKSKNNHDIHNRFEYWITLDEETLMELQAEFAQLIPLSSDSFGESQSDKFVKTSLTLIKVLDEKLSDYFIIDDAFLRAHQKTPMKTMLEGVVGFTEYYDKENEVGSFEKLFKSKTDDIIKSVLGCGFDFKNHIPKSIKTFSS